MGPSRRLGYFVDLVQFLENDSHLGQTPMFGYLAITVVLSVVLLFSGILMMRRLQGALPLHL